MENVDNYFNDMKTSNGDIIQFIKNSLEKELSIPMKNHIKDTVYYIVKKWGDYLDLTCTDMNYLENQDGEYDFEKAIGVLSQNKKIHLCAGTKNALYKHSPIETLYLKIVQHESIGRIRDILMINNIQAESEAVYDVPFKFIEEMKIIHTRSIDVDDVENYIDEKASNIAKYVYLKSETNKEDRRRIRNSVKKVRKLLEFLDSAKRINFKVEGIVPELLIISCLQAIILDKRNETFEYIFHGYENQSKRHPQVQGALKNDSRTYDALKTYWVRKVMDHWYANIGRYKIRKKFRELENICDEILISIFEYPNIDEMMQTHNFYFSSLYEIKY